MSSEKADVQRAIDAYYASFVRRFNPPAVAEAWLKDLEDPHWRKKPRSVNPEHVLKPEIGPKQAKLFKDMVKQWGVEEVVEMAGIYPFIRDDRWIDSNGYTVEVLKTSFQRLLLRKRGLAGGGRADRTRGEIARVTGGE